MSEQLHVDDIPLRVVGLDLSLTSSGMSDGSKTHVVRTYPTQSIEVRLDLIWRVVRAFSVGAFIQRADLVVIEGASYGSRGPGHEELAAARLMVRHMMWRHGVPFAIVPPTTLKLYTTGSGKATKQDVVAAVDGRHMANLHTYTIADGRYDRADAFALAAMGYDHVGQPLPQRTAALPPHRASLEAVTWPDLLSD